MATPTAAAGGGGALSSQDQAQLQQLAQQQQEAQQFQLAMSELDTQNSKQQAFAKDVGDSGKQVQVNT